MLDGEHRARRSGGGDRSMPKIWDWNSPYWRKLGAPWGGTHSFTITDIWAIVNQSSFYEKGTVVKPETARLMITNHNKVGLNVAPGWGLWWGRRWVE